MSIDLNNFIEKLEKYKEGLKRVGDTKAYKAIGTIIANCTTQTIDDLGFFAYMLKEKGLFFQKKGKYSEAKAWLYAATWLEEELYDPVAYSAHNTKDLERVDD